MNKITILSAVILLSLSSLSMAGVVLVEDPRAAKAEKERQEKQVNERETANANNDNGSQYYQPKPDRDDKPPQKKNLNKNLIFGF